MNQSMPVVKAKPKKHSIRRGQQFYAPSKGKAALWVVTRRAGEKIYTKVLLGEPQKRTYIPSQFHYLLSKGIAKLVR